MEWVKKEIARLSKFSQPFFVEETSKIKDLIEMELIAYYDGYWLTNDAYHLIGMEPPDGDSSTDRDSNN